MPTDRTSLRLSDERKLLLDRAGEIVATDHDDDPPMSEVIDAALTHLIQSEENIQSVRGEYPPQQIQECCNTDVLGLNYRTEVNSKWR